MGDGSAGIRMLKFLYYSPWVNIYRKSKRVIQIYFNIQKKSSFGDWMKVSVLFLLFLSGVFSVIGIANTFKMYSDARGACFARLGDEGDFNGRFTEYGKIEGFCIYGNTSKRIDMRKEGIEEATEIEEDEIIYDEFDMREDDWEIKFITMEKIEDDE